MLKRFRNSLVWKLVALAAFVEVSVLTTLHYSQQTILDHYFEQQFEQSLTPIKSLINTTLAPTLFAEDLGGIAQRVDDIRQNLTGVEYIVVDDTQDKLLAKSGHVSVDIKAFPESKNVRATPQGIYHTYFPIKLGGEVVGHAHIGLNISAYQYLSQGLTNSYLYVGLAGALIGTILIGFLAYLATRHLRTLDQGAKRAAKGDFSHQLDIHSSDEIGRVTAAFNHMMMAVAEHTDGLIQEKTRFAAIADHTYAWEIWIDSDKKLIWTNPSATEMTGFSPTELLAMEDFPKPLLPAGSLDKLPGWQRLLREEKGNGFECVLQQKSGEKIWVAIYWQPISDDQGNVLGTRASFIDISERRKTQEYLQQSMLDLQASEASQHQQAIDSQRQQARFRALLSAMNLGILFETNDRKVEYTNPAFEEMWALDPNYQLPGSPVEDVLEHSRHIFARPSNSSRYVLQVENTHEISEQFELSLADGRTLTQVSYPVRDNDARMIGRLWLYEDVTYERQTAEQLLYLAERDSLTGLFNRHRFQLEMERMVSMSQRYNKSFALLYFDLDEFKYINDTYGHREGDTVLTRIAGELSQLVRKNDVFARLGGDEFAILSIIDKDMEEIQALAHRVVSAVSQIPFRFHGRNIRMTTSVGISRFPEMAENTDTLVAQADAAMYQAKNQGKNTWSVYDQQRDSTESMMTQMSWSQRIEHGLENDLFELHFQGVYNVKQGNLSHLEALVRLRDIDNPEKIYMPGQFIPIAEKSGKILSIDQWVTKTVIKMLSERPDMPSVAINISGRSFDDPSLPQRIHTLLTEMKVEPCRLLIELTETAAVSDIQDAQRFIEALHQTGCVVCLDDFGSGFSSFSYLKHITADVLKIDGQFIHDLPNQPDNQIFLRAMLDVAKGLNKATIAEFVDSQQVLEMLEEFGVDMAQGYFLDKPQLDHPAIPHAANNKTV